MQQWLNARSAKLLEELNKIPFTDDAEDVKLNLIRAAMREVSVEMFQRAADNSRKQIDTINKEAVADRVDEVQAKNIENILGETEALLAEADAEPSAEQAPTDNPAGGMNSALGVARQEPAQTDESTESAQPAADDKSSKSDDGEESPKLKITSSVIRRSD